MLLDVVSFKINTGEALSISIFPWVPNVGVVKVPVRVIFLNPVISLFESTTTPFDVDTVPAVTPSKTFNSAAVDVIPSKAVLNSVDVTPVSYNSLA